MKTVFEESFFSVFLTQSSSVFWDMKSDGGETSLWSDCWAAEGCILCFVFNIPLVFFLETFCECANLACPSKARQLISSCITANISTLFISELVSILQRSEVSLSYLSLLSIEVPKEWCGFLKNSAWRYLLHFSVLIPSRDFFGPCGCNILHWQYPWDKSVLPS